MLSVAGSTSGAGGKAWSEADSAVPDDKLRVVRVGTSGASTDAGRAGDARGARDAVRLEASSVAPEGTSVLEVKTPVASTDAGRAAEAVEGGAGGTSRSEADAVTPEEGYCCYGGASACASVTPSPVIKVKQARRLGKSPVPRCWLSRQRASRAVSIGKVLSATAVNAHCEHVEAREASRRSAVSELPLIPCPPRAAVGSREIRRGFPHLSTLSLLLIALI